MGRKLVTKDSEVKKEKVFEFMLNNYNISENEIIQV